MGGTSVDGAGAEAQRWGQARGTALRTVARARSSGCGTPVGLWMQVKLGHGGFLALSSGENGLTIWNHPGLVVFLINLFLKQTAVGNRTKI